MIVIGSGFADRERNQQGVLWPASSLTIDAQLPDSAESDYSFPTGAKLLPTRHCVITLPRLPLYPVISR